MALKAPFDYKFSDGYTARELGQPEVLARANNAKAALLDVAVAKIGALNELCVRRIMPNNDLALTNENWVTVSTGANSWNNYLNVQLGAAQAAVFYGVYNRDNNPVTSAVRYRQGNAGAGGVLHLFNVEEAFIEDNNVFYHSPVIYQPTEWINFQYYASQAVTQRLGLLGFIVEKSGMTLTGDKV